MPSNIPKGWKSLKYFNNLKIIEKKAYKPHAVYKGGARRPPTSVSYAITIPINFAREMGLDEENCYVISHLVIAYDNGDPVEFSAEDAAESVMNSTAEVERKKLGQRRGNNNRNNNHSRKEKKAYLVVEKLLT